MWNYICSLKTFRMVERWKRLIHSLTGSWPGLQRAPVPRVPGTVDHKARVDGAEGVDVVKEWVVDDVRARSLKVSPEGVVQVVRAHVLVISGTRCQLNHNENELTQINVHRSNWNTFSLVFAANKSCILKE